LAIASVEKADWVALILKDRVPGAPQWDDMESGVELWWQDGAVGAPWCIRVHSTVLERLNWFLDESVSDIEVAVQLVVLRATDNGFDVSLRGASTQVLDGWLDRETRGELVQRLGAARLCRLHASLRNLTR
jgi:hypothetical protein